MACWKEKEKLYTEIFRESFSKLYDSSQKSTFHKRQAGHCRNSNNFFSDLVVARKSLINKNKSNKRASSYKNVLAPEIAQKQLLRFKQGPNKRVPSLQKSLFTPTQWYIFSASNNLILNYVLKLPLAPNLNQEKNKPKIF